MERDVEHAWVLIGESDQQLWSGRLQKLGSGTPCRVAFNWRDVLDREEQHGDIIGFLHTHPGMAAIPSSVDHNTMKAWVASFGKPLLCAILGVDGLRVYEYIDDERPPLECPVCQRIDHVMFGLHDFAQISFDKTLDAGEGLFVEDEIPAVEIQDGQPAYEARLEALGAVPESEL